MAKYRIKNTKTGQLGYTIYETIGAARASAKDHSAFHGTKCIAVSEDGSAIQKDYRNARRNDGAQRMVDRFNFGRAATR